MEKQITYAWARPTYKKKTPRLTHFTMPTYVYNLPITGIHKENK